MRLLLSLEMAIGLLILFVTGAWWPGLLFVAGLAALLQGAAQDRYWLIVGIAMLIVGAVIAAP